MGGMVHHEKSRDQQLMRGGGRASDDINERERKNRTRKGTESSESNANDTHCRLSVPGSTHVAPTAFAAAANLLDSAKDVRKAIGLDIHTLNSSNRQGSHRPNSLS